MKYLLLLLLPCVLYAASNVAVQYQDMAYVNELTGIFNSSDGVYKIYDLDPNYSSNAMVDVFQNLTTNDYYDPKPELDALGCNRKLHILADGRLYCTDDVNQLLLRISEEPPFTVLETFYIGFPDTGFDDWLDPDTQYLVFVDFPDWPTVTNFTIFNTSNNQWIPQILANTSEFLGAGYGIEGYFITPTYIGWGVTDDNGVRPTQIWKCMLEGQDTSYITTINATDIHRIIVLNYTHTVCIDNNYIYTIEIATGEVNNATFQDPVSDINKINHTHFTVSSGNQISLYTIDEGNQLVQAALVDLSDYLHITNVTLNPPDCCADQGFLQSWVAKPQQNSYFMLDLNTLEIIDYETPYQVGTANAPYFPSFVLGNGTLVSPMYDGYRLGDSEGNFLGFVPVPMQDVYYDPSGDDFVFGFFTGATDDYPDVTQCYLLSIQKSTSSFKTIDLLNCPNPTKNSSLNLLDVQCSDDTNCNVVYQAIDAIYVLNDNSPYLIKNKFAIFGNTLAFPQYSNSLLSLVAIIPDEGGVMGQVLIGLFDFTSGEKVSSKVLSLYGTASKMDANTVMYSYSYLLDTTLHSYNVTSGSSLSNNTIAESLVSTVIPLSSDAQSFVTMNPTGGVSLYQLGGQASINSVTYSSMGSAFIQQTGKSSFVLTTYNTGMQNSLIYSLVNQKVKKIKA